MKMTRLMTIRHHGPLQTRRLCDAQAATITTSSATEIFARCAPIASGTSKNGYPAQSRVVYEGLAQLLEQCGAALEHVVTERVFFRDVVAGFDDFQRARQEAYRKRGVTGGKLPATTYVQQPPCRPGQDVELQAYAVAAAPGASVHVLSLSPARENVVVKMLEIGPARHLFVANVPGHDGEAVSAGTFRQQSDRMFCTAAQTLRGLGVAFDQVLRTWICLDDIDRDYAELNASRNSFFQQEGIRRLPASTGIGGGSRRAANRCTLDLYALLTPEIAEIEPMQTPTLNEAPQYGSAFSRGMKVALPEQTYLFISGTASVDEAGATAHLGDVRGQIERMLWNIEELLRPHGAGWADVAQAVTFLKSAEYLGPFQEILNQRGPVQGASTIVEAGVCRPELLCEMEAIAVLPSKRR